MSDHTDDIVFDAIGCNYHEFLEQMCAVTQERPEHIETDKSFLRSVTPKLIHHVVGGRHAAIDHINYCWNLLYDSISYFDAVIDHEVEVVDWLPKYPQTLTEPMYVGTVVNVSAGIAAEMGIRLAELLDPAWNIPSATAADIQTYLWEGFKNMSAGQQASVTYAKPSLAQSMAILYPASACLITPMPGSDVSTLSMHSEALSLPSATTTIPAWSE